MKLSEVLELIDLAPRGINSRKRRIESALSIDDLEKLAERVLPRSVFDYIAGGSEREVSLRGNLAAFDSWRFVPRSLVDVEVTSTSTTILGRAVSNPFGFAPTGYTKMISPSGEPAVAAAAAAAGIPYVLSTMATTSIEQLANALAGSDADLWFQLYVWRDRALTSQLVDRAANNGYRVLEIAVDTSVAAVRRRDVKNGFTIPPRLTPASLFDIALKPRYWMGMIANPGLTFANVAGSTSSGGGYTISNITSQFDPSVTWKDLDKLRKQWPGKLVLKGPIGPEDARRAHDAGVDGIHISNHGGRQLDNTIAPINLIRPVREAIGKKMEVFVDSGVRSGADIALAVALGANAAFVGRPYLFGLAAGGRSGVDKVISLFQSELLRTMQLLGTPSITELSRQGSSVVWSSDTKETPNS